MVEFYSRRVTRIHAGSLRQRSVVDQTWGLTVKLSYRPTGSESPASYALWLSLPSGVEGFR
jgi:hypothetical protein